MDEIKSKIEQAAAWMELMAGKPSVGYDQNQRWGPDYDCSSLVISAWEWADVPVKQQGASYTGNMYKAFLACGFEDVTHMVNLDSGVGLVRGDVLLNHINHTAMYIGEGETVEASINEHGLTTGGQTGDQTGREVLCRAYRNYPWDCVLRYTGGSFYAPEGSSGAENKPSNAPTYFYTLKLPLLKTGMQSLAVGSLAYLLQGLGYYKGDGSIVMSEELTAALMDFQRDNALEVDGECGGQSWTKLLGV